MKRAVIVLLAAVLPGAAGAVEDKPSKAIDELRQCVDPQRLPEERVEHCTGALRAGTLDAVQTANAHYHSGLASLAMGNQEKAIEEFDQVLRIEPEMAKAYNGRGIARTQHGDLDRAIADYDQALRIEPKLAYVYANRGSAWLGKKDHDKALADFNLALQLEPQSAWA